MAVAVGRMPAAYFGRRLDQAAPSETRARWGKRADRRRRRRHGPLALAGLVLLGAFAWLWAPRATLRSRGDPAWLTFGVRRRQELLRSALVVGLLVFIEAVATGAVTTEAFLAGPAANARQAAQAAAAATSARIEHLPDLPLPSLNTLPRLSVIAPPAPRPKTPPPPAPDPKAPASPPSMAHLPAWVQAKPGASLWSGPDDEAVRFTTLPAWTFLKVVGVEGERLHVEYAGDGGPRQPGPGWVAVDQVQPSDPGQGWLRNHRASRLFDGPDAGASVITPIAQWSSMLTLDGPAAERVHVRVYAADFQQVVAEGWVPAADVGPTGPPQRSVSTQSLEAAPSPFPTQSSFIEAVGAAAREAQARTGVPASVTVAQAILESHWGDSLLSRLANNYFGIKAMGRLGNDGAVWLRTMEYDAAGGAYSTLAPFRAYKSLADAIADHSQLFRTVGLYRAAMQVTDNPNEFARRIAAGGYSTDPAYAQKLIGLMATYDLYRFDTSA